MRVALYARVSTDDQVRTGYSLPAQLRACREKAESLGATSCVEYVDDGESGATLDRPALQRLRDDARMNRVGAIVTLDPDRLSRDLIHLLLLTDEFETQGIRIHYVNMSWENTPEGRLFLSLRGAVSEFERAKIKERTLRGRRQKALSGRIAVAPVHMHGYRWDPVTDTLTVVEEEANAIRRIFELYVDYRLGTGLVARKMTEEGWPPPVGTKWHQNTIRRILRNPAYMGSLRQFWQSDPSKAIYVPCPAIITPDLFAQAQLQLDYNRKRNPGRSAASSEYSLLSGLVFCGVCGSRMYLNAGFWPRGGKRYGYYICQKRRNSYGTTGGKHFSCMNPPHRMEPVDVAAWKAFRELLDMPDDSWRERFAAALSETRGGWEERERLAREIATLQSARERVLRYVTLGTVSDSEAEAVLRETYLRLTELRARLAALEVDAGPTDPDKAVDHAVAHIHLLRTAAAAATTVQERREIIRRAVERVVIHPDRRIVLEPRVLILTPPTDTAP